MKLTEITISYGETVSLPGYSNTKPQITLTATIGPDDDPAEIELLLWAHARQAVQAQADTTLEQNDQPAKYDPAPRYQVMRTYYDRYGRPKDEIAPPIIVVVFPDDNDLDRESYGARFVHAGYAESRKLRYQHAMRVAAKAARENNNAEIIDCSDGNLQRLKVALKRIEQMHPEAATAADNPF